MTRPAARPLTALVLLASLAACGGGSGGGGTGPLPTAFERHAIEANDLIAAANAQEDYTPEASLPTGQAVYEGKIALAEDETYAVAGDLSLTIDFSSPDLDVGGAITNVADSDGRSYDGTLDVGEDYNGVSSVNPTADPTLGEEVFSADFGGQLTAGLDAWDVDGSLGGAMVGPDADYAVGTANAEVCQVGPIDDCTFLSDGIIIAAPTAP